MTLFKRKKRWKASNTSIQYANDSTNLLIFLASSTCQYYFFSFTKFYRLERLPARSYHHHTDIKPNKNSTVCLLHEWQIGKAWNRPFFFSMQDLNFPTSKARISILNWIQQNQPSNLRNTLLNFQFFTISKIANSRNPNQGSTNPALRLN